MMIETLYALSIILSLVTLVLLIFGILRFPGGEKINALREELRAGREEAGRTARDTRDEISKSLKDANDTVSRGLSSMAAIQRGQLDTMTEQLTKTSHSNQEFFERLRDVLEGRVKELQLSNETKIEQLSCTVAERIQANEEELSKGLKIANETLATALMKIGEFQTTQLETMQSSFERIRSSVDFTVKELQQSNEAKFGDIRRTIDEQLATSREELSTGFACANETLSLNLNDIFQAQHIQLQGMTNQLKDFAEANQNSQDRIRLALDSRVKELQDSNEKKLEEMRRTVDEKLHETLEKRLGTSFNVVSERLEAVQRGLGEMQNLAAGVGDLQRVLTNVKVRGTWAEVQLGNLLDQILAPGQYQKNVRVKSNSGESVEYAIRVPSKGGGDPDGYLWLPIDSKFPQQSYLRVQEAADRGDPEATKKALDDLFRTIRTEAQQIHVKYINPPVTTDFAIMFLATEGLYGEALRQPSLLEDLQRRYRIVIAGPTTLAAILNSFRMGFQTLAIEQRASEVVKLLGAVKTQFGKFGDVLDKVKRQLNTATRTIEESGVRSRVIERRLRSVEELPEIEAAAVLQLSDDETTVDSDELDENEIVQPETEASDLLPSELQPCADEL